MTGCWKSAARGVGRCHLGREAGRDDGAIWESGRMTGRPTSGSAPPMRQAAILERPVARF